MGEPKRHRRSHRKRYRDHAHALRPACNDQVAGSAHHALRGKVNCLLRGSALAVDGNGRNLFGKPRSEPRGPGHVARLWTHRVYTPEDHIVDERRVETATFDDRAKYMRAEVRGMDFAQGTVLASDRRPDSVDDESFRHRRLMQRGRSRRNISAESARRPGPETAARARSNARRRESEHGAGDGD